MFHLLSRHLPAVLRINPKLALFTLLATAASGFGQTFFVSFFGGEIRQAFELTHTAYGCLYSGATLCSALLLLRFGGLVDTWTLPRVTALALGILVGGCLLIGFAPGALVLAAGFICIRFGGQGMISHIGMTTAARYFAAHRGRAVALAAMGFPLAEAVLPAGAALFMVWGGWRMPWIVGAGLLCLLILPVLRALSHGAPPPHEIASKTHSEAKPGQDRSRFSRRDVLRDPGYYLILPATLLTPFTVTALFFHQMAFADELGWTLELLATGFSVYAACHLGALFVAGPFVDRLGAARALPLTLIPIISGLLLLASIPSPLVLFAYLGAVGATQGLSATASGAIWAERYGILHLGAIRSMNQAVMVVSTAASPILLGFFLDRQVEVATLALGLAGCAVLAAMLARLGAWLEGRGARTQRPNP
ncbi:MFS transporter [Desulfonatronum thioautotrophicum]|uniref:MFS transporter n=1 Tax=Desulfonatronum thioautotrophicum TaxID=617001 RepID=UPI0005EAF8A6|nr:MFS transporter [Desulfonatronum thioautotrophicum]